MATFAAFVVAGSLPLFVYLIGLVVPIAPETAFPIAIVLSAAALFGVRSTRARSTLRCSEAGSCSSRHHRALRAFRRASADSA
jgi:hypothetical protein